MNRREVAGRAGAAFAAAQSQRYKEAVKVTFAGVLVAFAYTFVLAMADQNYWGAWIRETQPVVDAMARVVPSVHLLAADLVHRGFVARAPYVSNVIAFQWLILGCFFFCAGVMLIPERDRLRAGVAAAGAVLRRNNASAWKRYVAWAFGIAMLVWIPFDGHSRDHIRFGTYDLGTGWGGLFFLLMLSAIWWWGMFYLWGRVLALTGKAGEAQQP
jgi:hypothetical protein